MIDNHLVEDEITHVVLAMRLLDELSKLDGGIAWLNMGLCG